MAKHGNLNGCSVLGGAVWALCLLVAGFCNGQVRAQVAADPGDPAGTVASADMRWWKGNLHTHTLWSDGDDFPEMIAERYKLAGYHFLALSDHNVLSQGVRWMKVADINKRARANAMARYVKRWGEHWVETRGNGDAGTLEVRLKPIDEYRALVEEAGRFLMIQGLELTATSGNGKAIHMNATNLLEQLLPVKGATVRDVMRGNIAMVEESAAKTGRQVVVHVNHPNYKWGVTAEDLAEVVNEPFVEIWNGVDDDNDPGDERRPGTEEIWDVASTLRLAVGKAPPLMGLATDDSHNYHGTSARSPMGRAWIMVRARHLTPESIVKAMRAGEFYASTGVVLSDVRYDAAGGKLAVKIEPVAGEKYVTRFIGTRKGANLVGKPRLDDAGKVIETTLYYRGGEGPQIGEVLAVVGGVNAEYQLKGDEWYVRAVVESDGVPEVQSREYPRKRAWTQPVGWKLE